VQEIFLGVLIFSSTAGTGGGTGKVAWA